MTRVHIKLIVPCFKTGLKNTQSSIVTDRYRFPRREWIRHGRTFVGLSKVNCTTNSEPGPMTALVPLVSMYRDARLRRPRRTYR